MKKKEKIETKMSTKTQNVRMYEGRLKSSCNGSSAPLLCLPLHNSGALPLVNEHFK
jgi:hypothetical protein